MKPLPTITARDLWATPPALVEAVTGIMGAPPIVDLTALPNNAKAGFWYAQTAKDSHVPPDWPQVPAVDDQSLFGSECTSGLLSINPAILAATIPRSAWAWMNPPYSKGNLPAFTAWARAFAEAGGTVALCVPASQSDGWWRENVAPICRMILIPDRRVQFVAPEDIEASGNDGQNAVAILSRARPWDGDPIVRRLVY